MAKLYWDGLEEGDKFTPVDFEAVTAVQIARFAGASDDYNPLHVDEEAAKAGGYGGKFAHGGLAAAFIHDAVRQWAPNSRTLRSQVTFQKLVWPGDTLSAHGLVVRRYEENDEHRVDIDVWLSLRGTNDLPSIKGAVTLVLWKDTAASKAGEHSLPPISRETLRLAKRQLLEAREAPKKGAKKAAAKKAAPKKAAAKKAAPKKAAAKKAAPQKAAAKKAAPKKAAAKKAAPKKAAAKKAAPKKAAAKKAAPKKAAAKKAAPKKAAAK